MYHRQDIQHPQLYQSSDRPKTAPQPEWVSQQQNNSGTDTCPQTYHIIEGVKANNLSAVITFIDFKKAFDTIHRGKMLRILKAYGLPPNILRAIEAMYTNTRAKIISPDGETDMFEITGGVLQGDTLAPFLFVIVLDYALRKALDGKEEDLGFTITPRKSQGSHCRSRLC